MNKEPEIVPKKNSVRDLLTLYYFKIPIFQRSYCWPSENWQDFWDDLTVHMTKKHDFFLGSIVTKDLKKDASCEIIDGQQRITTCIILLAAVRDYLREQKNELANEIQTYISHKEALRATQARLKLNENDDRFFQKHIIPLENEIGQVKNRGLSIGEKNIHKAYLFFREQIKAYSANITELLRNLLDNTYVIVIQVTDDMQAYTVFETLNARGIDLTAADLIKNSVLAKASGEGKLPEVLMRWNRVSQYLSNYSITLFLKYYLSVLQGSPIREKDLFKQIKTSGYIDNDVLSFASKVETVSEVYLQLLEPKANYWEDKEIPKTLNNINTLRLKTCYPLLLAIALSRHNTNVKKELFKEVEKLGFRYSIIMNKNPNALEVKYADWANKLFQSKIEIQKLKAEINKSKPHNDEFYEKFKIKAITENKIATYILKEIAVKSQGVDIFSVDDSATLEHIVPCKPEKWIDYVKANNKLEINGEEFGLEQFLEEIIFRLGNQTLLLPEDNSKIGNEAFDIKKKVYAKSKFVLNQKISKEKIWSLSQIVQYQDEMAKLALQIW